MKPNSTVAGSGVGAAFGVVAVWAIGAFTDVVLTPGDAAMLTGAIGTLAAWLVRYLPKPG